MPLYFFEIEDEGPSNHHGVELSNFDRAAEHAIGLGEAMLRRHGIEVAARPGRVIVKDQAGEVLASVRSERLWN